MKTVAGIAFIVVALLAGVGGWVWALAAREVGAKPAGPVEIPQGDLIDAPLAADAEPVRAAPPRGRTAAEDGYEEVRLQDLGAFAYEQPKPGDPERKDVIPGEIAALDGRKVAIRGIIIPWDVEREGVKSFILSPRFFGCCWGDMARVNEIVMVEMVGSERVRHTAASGFIIACGMLSVGEERDKEGYLLSVFRMKCDKVMYER